jgi:hypothetical protein
MLGDCALTLMLLSSTMQCHLCDAPTQDVHEVAAAVQLITDTLYSSDDVCTDVADDVDTVLQHVHRQTVSGFANSSSK